ncbi:MAG: hypothetical protein CMF69_08635 [Magnetovibrio sp.]|nr:hypothetical protein [Magnetovibrio sp.]
MVVLEPLTIGILCAVSIFVGLLIGCVGIGGVLLVPFLTHALGLSIHVSIAAAMFGYIFVGAVAAVLYGRHGSIEWPKALWLIAGAMPAAYFGSFLVSVTPAFSLELIIAVLVGLAGLNALRQKSAVTVERKISNPVALLTIGSITGVGSALTGTGGPLFAVPILVSLNVSAHAAIGFSQAVQMPLAFLATMGNLAYGIVNIVIGGIVASGLVIGGYLGARLAHILSPVIMQRVIAWVLVLVGLFLLCKLSLGLV